MDEDGWWRFAYLDEDQWVDGRIGVVPRLFGNNESILSLFHRPFFGGFSNVSLHGFGCLLGLYGPRSIDFFDLCLNLTKSQRND